MSGKAAPVRSIRVPQRVADYLSSLIDRSDTVWDGSEQPMVMTPPIEADARPYAPLDVDHLAPISAPLARAFRVLPLGEFGESFVAVADSYAPEVTREFLEALATKPLRVLIVTADELDAMIDEFFGLDEDVTVAPTSLTEILVASDTLSAEQVAEAAFYAMQTGTSLGPAVIQMAYVNPWNLALLLSRYLAKPVVNLRTQQFPDAVTALLPQELLRARRIVPIGMTETTLTLAMVDPFDDATCAAIAQATGREVRVVLTTDRDIDWALRQLYRTENITQSTTALRRDQSENSAHVTFERRQVIGFAALLVVVIVGMILDWRTTLAVINICFVAIYASFAAYKTFLILQGGATNLVVNASPEDVASLTDEELPTITVLIPLYREAAIVPVLLRAIANMDYPAIKLDVKILLEEEDEETAAAVRAAHPPEHFKIVRVPDAMPKTKPKACNYGLIEATGDLLVIYDAEDIPDSDQLKKCVVAFRSAPDEVTCIQAKLNYFNPYENMLTGWFTLEYSQWFDLFLPGLGTTRAPIPLGGTSNFFITERLIEAGAWDPYNVTEDADLGIRLFKLGYRTAILDSTTFEEANTQYGNWIRQRSRWVKGYMQTWLVHNRHPFRLWRELGTRNFWSVQATVGGSFMVLLINPILWSTSIIWFLFHPPVIAGLFSGVLSLISFVALVFGNLYFIITCMMAAMRRKYYGLVVPAVLIPIYWLMMSVAAYKALWQLITKPFYWEKTSHGLSTTGHAEAAISSQRAGAGVTEKG